MYLWNHSMFKTGCFNFFKRNNTLRKMGKGTKTWFKPPWWCQGHSPQKHRWGLSKVVRFFYRQKLARHEFIWHSETFLTGMKKCKVKFIFFARLIQDRPIYRYLKYICLWLVLSVKLIFYFHFPILASGKIMKFKVKTIQLTHTSPCVLSS